MIKGELTKGELPVIYEEAQVVTCTVEEARSLLDLHDLNDELSFALDAAQGAVYVGETKAAYLVLKIVPVD